MLVACMTNVFRDDPPEEAFRKIATSGFKHIELASLHCDYDPPDPQRARSVREVLSKHGLDAPSFYLYFKPAPDLGGRIESARRGLKMARMVGAGTAVQCSEGFPREFFEAVAEECRLLGLRYAIENHNKSPLDIARLLRGLPECVGAALDTGWFAVMGHSPLEALDALEGRIFVVHLKDIRPGGDHRTAPYGEGICQLDEFMTALARSGFDGIITVELEPDRIIRLRRDDAGRVVGHEVERIPMTDEEKVEALGRARRWVLERGGVE